MPTSWFVEGRSCWDAALSLFLLFLIWNQKMIELLIRMWELPKYRLQLLWELRHKTCYWNRFEQIQIVCCEASVRIFCVCFMIKLSLRRVSTFKNHPELDGYDGTVRPTSVWCSAHGDRSQACGKGPGVRQSVTYTETGEETETVQKHQNNTAVGL